MISATQRRLTCFLWTKKIFAFTNCYGYMGQDTHFNSVNGRSFTASRILRQPRSGGVKLAFLSFKCPSRKQILKMQHKFRILSFSICCFMPKVGVKAISIDTCSACATNLSFWSLQSMSYLYSGYAHISHCRSKAILNKILLGH